MLSNEELDARERAIIGIRVRPEPGSGTNADASIPYAVIVDGAAALADVFAQAREANALRARIAQLEALLSPARQATLLAAEAFAEGAQGGCSAREWQRRQDAYRAARDAEKP